jgi:formylglycine-generating enzyme
MLQTSRLVTSRHSLSLILAAAVVSSACDGRRSSAPEPPQPQIDRGASPEAVVEPAASAEAQPLSQPDAAPPPEPERLPDGTSISPCDDPPAGMACIPGGPFVRGSDDGPPHARPAAVVHLQTFYMDVHEVTYAEYKACEKAKQCPRSGPRYTDFDHPNMPIQGVSWYDAKTYCEAHGKQLPTEAQWEKAARGPDGHLHPWGDEPATCERAIIRDGKGRSCGLQKAISKPETGRPWDVGSRPAGVYGLHDMSGNAWEWVADWHTRSYEACGEPCLGVDPKGPCGGAEPCPGHRNKIVRGGSWYWEAEKASGIYRRAHAPDNQPFHHFGFRCAATLQQATALRAQQ